MGKKSETALEKAQRKASMQQVTVLEFVIFTSVPYWICMVLNKEFESMEQARTAGKFATAVCVVLNLFLIAKGSYRLVWKRKKADGKAAEEAAKAAAEEAAKAAAAAAAPTSPGDAAREAARNAAANSGGKIGWSPTDPDWLTVKDPATGAESGYKLNPETGEWTNIETGGVLDTDGLGGWLKQREKDSAWIRQQNENIRNNRTAFDDKLNEMRAQAAAEQKAMEEQAKHIQYIFDKYHTLDDSPENIKKIIAREQTLNSIEGAREARRGNIFAVLETGATWTLKAADYGMDVLGEMTGPAGKHVIKNLYIAGRNLGGRLTEAYIYDKDMGFAARHALGDTVVDITQSEVSNLGWGYRYAANAGGDSYKAVMQALADGEDPVEAGAVGFISGNAKTAAEYFVDKGTGFMQKSYAKTYTKKMLDMNKLYMKGGMKESVYKGCTQVLKRQMDTSAVLIEKVGGTLTSDVSKDIAGNVSDKLFNTHRKW